MYILECKASLVDFCLRLPFLTISVYPIHKYYKFELCVFNWTCNLDTDPLPASVYTKLLIYKPLYGTLTLVIGKI